MKKGVAVKRRGDAPVLRLPVHSISYRVTIKIVSKPMREFIKKPEFDSSLLGQIPRRLHFRSRHFRRVPLR